MHVTGPTLVSGELGVETPRCIFYCWRFLERSTKSLNCLRKNGFLIPTSYAFARVLGHTSGWNYE